MIEIYTDGACKRNPGPGGWAAILVRDGGKPDRFSGGPVARTTNQRMEVQAAIEGLKRVPAGARATVYSDSQYLVNTMTKGWKRRVNHDLWAKLDRLVAHRQVDFHWIRGHFGHPLQEEADRLASQAAKLAVSGGAALSGERDAGAATGPEADNRPSLSHVDEQGRARMVDITAKAESRRVAVARGRVVMAPSTLELVRSGHGAKGDVLAVARVAGIMGAKRTPDLIPLCHPLLITDVAVDFNLDEARSAVEITATARTTGKTGVEMEALTAVATAALTIYDMCKAADRAMRIDNVRLVRKSGGKSGEIVLE